MINLYNEIVLKKGYRLLLLKLAGFFLLLFMLDYMIGGIFSFLYFKQTSGWEYRTKYSIEDTRADILIFGASRAQQQYNPVFFEERLNQTCYNVGRDGEPIFYSYGVLKGILKRYIPRMIILDIENREFLKSQSSYDRIAVLLPFYKRHPEMHPLIELKGPYEKLKLRSRIYPYNSLLFKIAMGNTNRKQNEDIKGYLPLTRSLDEPIRTVDLSDKYEVDTNKVNIYRSFINDCKDAKIKLLIVCSPYFIRAVGTDTSMVLAKAIARENWIDFVDFSKDDYFQSHSKLFDDTVHVNITGSKRFSNQLVDTIIAKNIDYDVE